MLNTACVFAQFLAIIRIAKAGDMKLSKGTIQLLGNDLTLILCARRSSGEHQRTYPFCKGTNIMRTFLLVITIMLVTDSLFAQGTLIFYNRGLTAAGGGTYNAPIGEFSPQATAQLFLLSGSGASITFTPLFPLQSFRPAPDNRFFTGPLSVTVPNQPAGTTGLNFVVRAWEGPNYETAAVRGQSAVFTVGPLGGTTASGQIFLPPDLGGPGGIGGLQSFIVPFPEPSTISLALLGAAVLLLRRRKDSTAFR
jgi:hypothetical protein